MKYLLILFLQVVHTSVLPAQIAPAHIVVLVLENKSYSQVAGNPLTPFINSVIADGHTALFTQSYGLTYPSQPNYLHLFSGSSQGIATNDLPTGLPFVAPNLGATLLQKGFSFAGYSEDLPAAGYNGEVSGAYARKHNPWVNWQGNAANGIPAALNKPFTEFPSDFSTLPTVCFVIPNQDNDMHNGTLEEALAKGDAWVQRNLSGYIRWCKSNNSVFMITFDEDDHFHNNQILTSVTGEQVIAGNYSQPLTHYNILRTIQDLYLLPYAGKSADSAAIKNIWKKVAVCKGGGIALTANITANTYQWQVNAGSGFVNIANNANYNGANTATLQLVNTPSAWDGYRYRCQGDTGYSNTQTITINNYWVGAVSDAWENPLNWNCGSTPDASTNVIVHTNRPLALNSSVTVKSFTISGGGIVTQKSNQQLIIAPE